jgi:cysteine synthase A
VWPSTGNYGIGGAWVGPRMGYESVVILPEEMSAERFEKIAAYGARAIKTPGCESNVKEIYDECKRLAAQPHVAVMNQFAEMANFRWHYGVTGAAAAEAVEALGAGRPAAFVSAMGSSGTIAAGDALKARFGTRIVGLEPIQCPTLSRNGYGGHAIEGIGDKHVTWIHHVTNMDAVMAIDDQECLLGLQLVAEPAGRDFLASEGGLGEAAHRLSTLLGVSGVCNILGAIKTAKWLGLGKEDAVVTVATDGLDRYPSVLRRLEKTTGPLTRATAEARLASIFRGQKLDWITEGTVENRERWHNLKYFTWVEQQGKTVAELDAQRSENWWADQAALAGDVDRRLREARGW